MKRISDFQKLKAQVLKDPALKAAYDALEDEFRLANEIIKIRTQLDLTQSQLAKKVGMQQAAIARLESGQSNPRYSTLAKIARALDKKVTFA